MLFTKFLWHKTVSVHCFKSLAEVETDQPEDPAVGTKRARMMPGSKIVLPSSDANDYSNAILRNTISRIANPIKVIILYAYNNYTGRNFFDFLVGVTGIHSRELFKSDNCPSWWPKDVVFSPVRGISSEAHSRCFQNLLLV